MASFCFGATDITGDGGLNIGGKNSGKNPPHSVGVLDASTSPGNSSIMTMSNGDPLSYTKECKECCI